VIVEPGGDSGERARSIGACGFDVHGYRLGITASLPRRMFARLPVRIGFGFSSKPRLVEGEMGHFDELFLEAKLV
jgi:hypothetical protein